MPTIPKQINNTKSPVILRIKQNFYNNRKIFFITILLQLLGLPLLSVITQISFYREDVLRDYNYNLEIYIVLSGIAFVFATGLGIFIAFRCFSYLYKKTETDMNLSLPVKASQRFIGDFFSGLIMYVVPYIGACILSLISLAIGRSYYPAFLESIASYNSVLILMTDGLLIMIMLYTLTSFISVCCGNSFECLIYTLLTNITLPLFFLVLSYIIFKDASGIDYSLEAMTSVIATSPIGGVIKILYYNNITSYLTKYENRVPFEAYDQSWNITWGLSFIAVTVILFSAAFYLYKKRKAEDVSKPLVFSFIYYAFVLITTIAIAGGMARINSFIPGITISSVVFLVMSIIKNRGLNKLLRPCIFYAFSVVISFSVVKLSDATDGFGQIYRVPDTSEIKSVILNSNNIFFMQPAYLQYSNFTDTNDIQLIVDMQSDIIDNYKVHDYKENYEYPLTDHNDEEFFRKYNTDRYNASDSDVEITYILKNKKIIYRYYTIPYSIMTEYVIKLAENNNYKEQIAENFREIVLYENDSALKKDIRISDPRYNISENLDVPDISVLQELADAYKKDIMNLTNEDIMNFEAFCKIYNFYIGTSFTNTIDVLKKNGLTVSALSDYTTRIQSLNNGIFFIADSNYIIEHNATETDIITNDCGTPCQYIVNEHDDDLLSELFNVAEPHYFTSEHCYVIAFGSKNYIIPPEYSKLAEEFMSESKLEKVQIP